MKKLLFAVVVVLGLVAVSEAREIVASSTRTATMCDWCDKEITCGLGYDFNKINFHNSCYDEFIEQLFEFIKGTHPLTGTVLDKKVRVVPYSIHAPLMEQKYERR
jgi:hypothetical protein